MNARRVLGTTIVGALALTLGSCGNAATPSGVAQGYPSFARSQKSDTYQWIDYGMGGNQYDYPKSGNPTGRKLDLYDSSGECSTGKATLWVVNLEGEAAQQYTYDGKYLGSLSSTSSRESFQRCAVSARSRDIAFTASHEVFVYRRGSQSSVMTYPLTETPLNAGYDPKNDLYVDATTTSQHLVLLELAAGNTSFQTVSLPNELTSAGSVQWDGSYVAVTDREAGKIYRYAITGYTGTLKGTVSLKGSHKCLASWIAAPYVFCSGFGKKGSTVYNYPAGGDSIATFSGGGGSSVVQVSK